MTRQVRVTQEDIPLVQEIFDALTKALESLPEALMKNAKFGVLAMTAIINMACRLAQTAGVPRDEFIRTNVKIWDDKANVVSKEKTWN
jgi:hypothetical protein